MAQGKNLEEEVCMRGQGRPERHDRPEGLTHRPVVWPVAVRTSTILLGRDIDEGQDEIDVLEHGVAERVDGFESAFASG
jgi:hypothetical protein